MLKLNRLITPALFALALLASPGQATAQERTNFDRQQFMQQMQQRITGFFRERLEITKDDEWTLVEGRLSKVLQGRMESLMGSMGGLRGMSGRSGGNEGEAGRGRGFPGFSQPDPEGDALQKALENKAPIEEVKTAMGKYRDARKAKRAELVKAQDQLRQVLSLGQEAILVSMGVLD